MNPDIAQVDGTWLLRKWTLVHDQPPHQRTHWRARLENALVSSGGQWLRAWIDQLMQLLAAIFLYSPQRRLTAHQVAQHPFWSTSRAMIPMKAGR